MRCRMEGCFHPVYRAGSVYCGPCLQAAGSATLCLQRAQLDDVEEVAPQSDVGQATAAGGDLCSTVAWEEPGDSLCEEVTQEMWVSLMAQT